MEVRKFTIKDYPIICRWYESRGEVVPSLDYFPETSYIASLNGEDMYHISIWKTNTPYCYFENFASNPNIPLMNKREILPRFLDYLLNLSNGMGFKMAFALSKNDKTSKLYSDMGWPGSSCKLTAHGRLT